MKVQLLKRGLFEKKFMDSHSNTLNMTTKEKFLGYFLGPLGLSLFAAVMSNLMELYYTQVFVLDQIYGNGTYAKLTIISRIVSIITGLLIGWAIGKTVSRQGRIRPYVLMLSLLFVLSGFCMFSVPNIGRTGQLIWVAVSFVLFNGVAGIVISLRLNYISLGSMNQKERTQVNTINTLSNYMIAGTIGGMLVGSVLYYGVLYGRSAKNWILLVGVFAIIAIPLIFVEYFNVKERVTMDNREMHGEDENAIPLTVLQQLKYLFTDKNWVLVTIISFIGVFGSVIRTGSVIANYCQYLLGANAQNQYQTIFLALTGIPLGIGVAVIYPLARKFGVKKVVIISDLIFIIFNLLCVIQPKNFLYVVICYFFANCGLIATTYIYGGLSSAALDNVELRCGYRLDGNMSIQIVGVLTTLLCTPLSGIYATVLVASNGYKKVLNADGTYQILIGRSGQNWIVFVCFVVPAILCILTVLCMLFMDLEKKLPEIHAALLNRRKEACLARGEEWVDPEEQKRRDEEAQVKQAEEARIVDLKSRCLKRNLDFDIENQKYLDKLAAKEAKAAKKKAKKA